MHFGGEWPDSGLGSGNAVTPYGELVGSALLGLHSPSAAVGSDEGETVEANRRRGIRRFLLTATARELGNWARKSAENEAEFKSQCRYGVEGLMELAHQPCGLTIERIRELYVMRMSIINPLTDIVDKCVGEQPHLRGQSRVIDENHTSKVRQWWIISSYERLITARSPRSPRRPTPINCRKGHWSILSANSYFKFGQARSC